MMSDTVTNSTHEDIVLNSIWAEMRIAKTNVYYSEFIIDRHQKRNKIYLAFISCCSAGGALLSFFNLIYPTAACFILSIANIIKAIMPCLIMKTDDLSKLLSLSIKYELYFSKQKLLFDNLYFDKILVSKAERQFHNLYNENTINAENISKIYGKVDIELNNKAAQKSDTYLNNIYYGKD